MEKYRKNRISKVVIILAALSFIAAFAESMTYYDDTPLFMRLLIALQDSINIFKFDPTLRLDAAAAKAFNGSELAPRLLAGAYAVALFTAPCCTIAAAYKLAERLLNVAVSFGGRSDREHIAVFGFNEDVRSLIKNYKQTGAKKVCIHIITDTAIAPEESFELIKRGCRIHNTDITKASSEEIASLIKKTRMKDAENIILFDSSSVKNFSVLQLFSLTNGDSRIKLGKKAKITCRCENEGIKELISDYYDSALKTVSRRPGEILGYDLETVSLPELQVRKMFGEAPLHSFYSESGLPLEKWAVKLLIVGFGSLGQQVMLQAMNLGSVHKDNPISADIFDIDADKNRELFMRRFADGLFESDENRIFLKNGAADGKFEFRFHDTNCAYNAFYDRIRESAAESPYTYVVITVDDTSTCVECAVQVILLYS